MANTNTVVQPNPAQIILAQLGGMRKLTSAIGAKDIYSDGKKNETLVFKFKAKSKNKSNYVRITLNSTDTYDVEFIKIGRKKCGEYGIMMPCSEVVSEHNGCYCDMLTDLFREETGLFINFKIDIKFED